MAATGEEPADDFADPLVDLAAQYRTIRPEIDEAIQRVLESSSFILGPKVAAFEEAFAAHVGARHCVGVSSGTARSTSPLMHGGPAG